MKGIGLIGGEGFIHDTWYDTGAARLALPGSWPAANPEQACAGGSKWRWPARWLSSQHRERPVKYDATTQKATAGATLSPVRTVVTNPSVAILEFLYVTHLSFQTAAKFIPRSPQRTSRQEACHATMAPLAMACQESAPLSSQIMCMHAPCRQTFAQQYCQVIHSDCGSESIR